MRTCRFPVFCFPVLRIRGRGLLVRKASVRLFSQLSPCHINHLFPWVVSYSSTSSCCHQTSITSLTCHSGHWELMEEAKHEWAWITKSGAPQSPRNGDSDLLTWLERSVGSPEKMKMTLELNLKMREVWGPPRKGRWLLSLERLTVWLRQSPGKQHSPKNPLLFCVLLFSLIPQLPVIIKWNLPDGCFRKTMARLLALFAKAGIRSKFSRMLLPWGWLWRVVALLWCLPNGLPSAGPGWVAGGCVMHVDTDPCQPFLPSRRWGAERWLSEMSLIMVASFGGNEVPSVFLSLILWLVHV